MKSHSLIFSVAVLLSISGCSGKDESSDSSKAVRSSQPGHTIIPADSPQLAHIKTAVASSQDVPAVEIVAPGKVEPDPTLVSKIVMPLSGRVGRVLVNLGDYVKKGQVVLTVDSADAATSMSTYRQAEANVAQSKASLAKADADAQRARDLFDHKAIAQKDVVAAETVQVQAKSALNQAEASLDESLKHLELLGLQPGSILNQMVSVRSSVSGKVIDINAVSGEFRNDTSTPVMTIADLNTVWVTADVPEDQVRFSKVGSPVQIYINAYPDEVFTGTVKKLGDMIDPQTRTLKVRVELANPGEKLRPEMFAQIHEKQGTVNLPVVPLAAVIENQGKSVVYIERKPGDFEEVPVQVAWQDNVSAAIRSGISVGDQVVTSGGMLLRSN